MEVAQLVVAAAYTALQAAVSAHAVAAAHGRLQDGPGRWAVLLSKAAAALINLHTSLLILGMCRASLTWLSDRLPWDWMPMGGAERMHLLLAAAWMWWAVVHAAGHWATLARVSGEVGTSYAGLAAHPTSVTGHALLGVLLVLCALALLRKTYRWEAFKALHAALFVAAVGLQAVHGMFCMLRLRGGACPAARSWLWITAPLCWYCLDHLYRLHRSRQLVYLVKVIRHGGEVLEVRFRKPAMARYRSGQYVILSFRSRGMRARREWHPFTLTSTPEELFYAAVHVKVCGDWTSDFARALAPDLVHGTALRVDGPYGSPSQHHQRYANLVCIGVGIGQTPFASILKSFWYTRRSDLRVLYIGVCRHADAYEWLHDILRALELKCPWLHIRYYVTGPFSAEQVRSVYQAGHRNPHADPITGLHRSVTQFRRPVWREAVGLNWSEERVGVFYCGPLGLRKPIQRACRASLARYAMHFESF